MSIFGAPSTGIGKTAPDAKLRVQTSVFGKPRPIVYGQVRIAGNLVQYGDFVATQQSSGSGGGKGGGGSSGGKGAAGSGSYTYKAAIMIGICEGPVTFTGAFWNNGAGTAFPDLGLGGYNGGYLQTGWPYWNSAHSATSLNYKGLAFVAAGPMDLGTSSTIPQLTFEVTGSINGAISGSPDADPAAVIPDFLANAHYGMGFPSAFIGNFSQYSAWCIANGLVVSPLIETQGEGRAFIQDMMTATCSEMVWDGAHLTVVPYADSSVTGNSITFTPNGVQFSLTDNDFLLPQGGNPNSAGTGSADPVQSNLNLTGRKNQVTVEFIDRANNYNPDPVVVQDDAHIQEYGIRPQDKKSFHLFALRSAAVRSAQLLLGRETVVTTYTFTVGSQYARLLPMDLIEITDAVLGLYAVVVRITEISENSDYSLTITGQEVPDGISTAPIHASQNSNSFSAGYNDAPGSTNHVLIWEPPVALAGAYEVWIAAAGNYNWSGAQVWVSTDDATFRLVGTLEGASRLGYTTNTLVSATVGINSGQSVIVDMTTSGAAITAGTHADALNGNTLSYISDGSTGEYIAFSDAALGSGETYTLGYLNRGMYNTKPISRTSGQHFVRVIDGGFLRFSLTTDRIGSTLHFKVLPFNQYGGGLVKLSDVTSIAYTPSGTSPSIPTGLAAAGGSHQITVIWNWSSQPDVDHVEIWRLLAAPSATPSNNAVAAGATLITQVYAASYTDTSVALGTPGTTGHYWIRYVAVTGVVSDWLGPVHATTAALTALDIADGILTTAKFASSISPVGLVSTVPSGYTTGNPQVVFNETDSKLYRWTGSAWTALIPAADLLGMVSDAQIAGMAATKLTTQILRTNITDGEISTPKLSSGAVTTDKLFAGSVSASKMTISGGNMVLDGAFADTSYWTFPASSAVGWFVDAGAIAGFLGIVRAAGLYDGAWTGTDYSSFSTPYNNANSVHAVPGTAYTLVATGYNSGNRDINVALIFYNAAGTYLSSASLVWSAGASTSATKRIQATAPSGAVTIAVIGEVHAGTAWSGICGIGGIAVIQAATGEMIVDGSIKTNHLEALSVDSDKLAANSAIFGKVAAGAIKAEQFVAGELHAYHLAADFALINSAQIGMETVLTSNIGDLQVNTIKVASGAISYFASAYNEYVWTPSGTYGADGSCTVSITITDANEIVLILFKTITEYTDHASGVVTGSTGGAGSGTNGSELGGPG
jgi:hypothetical protein